jgi:hypothetical protein
MIEIARRTAQCSNAFRLICDCVGFIMWIFPHTSLINKKRDEIYEEAGAANWWHFGSLEAKTEMCLGS